MHRATLLLVVTALALGVAALVGCGGGDESAAPETRDDNLLGLCAASALVATDPDEAVQIAQAQQDRFAEALR